MLATRDLHHPPTDRSSAHPCLAKDVSKCAVKLRKCALSLCKCAASMRKCGRTRDPASRRGSHEWLDNSRLRITFCSRYAGGMVGSPKNLSDLHRIEAQVQVTCRSCRAVEVWELNALIAEVRKNGGNTDWNAARRAVNCPHRCASPMIQLLPLPYGKQRARQRAHRHALINLSLQILREAASRSSREVVGTLEVRLALHVLRPFVGDQRLLNEFWSAATAEPRHPWTSCHIPYRGIAQRLIDRGAPVDVANRP